MMALICCSVTRNGRREVGGGAATSHLLLDYTQWKKGGRGQGSADVEGSAANKGVLRQIRVYFDRSGCTSTDLGVRSPIPYNPICLYIY